MAQHEKADTMLRAPRRRGSLSERIRGEDAYGVLLLLIFVTLLASALVDLRLVSVATVLLQGLALLFAQWTSRVRPRVLRISAAAVLVGAVVSAVGTLPDHERLVRLDLIVSAVLAAGTILIIVRRIGLHPAISGATILAAVCVYLLIGMLFADIFHIIGAFSPPFFARGGHGSATNFLYYSYSTLATVGYGDLTAERALGRMLSVTEALIGQLYLVTIVALAVGNIGRAKQPFGAEAAAGLRPWRSVGGHAADGDPIDPVPPADEHLGDE